MAHSSIIRNSEFRFNLKNTDKTPPIRKEGIGKGVTGVLQLSLEQGQVMLGQNILAITIDRSMWKMLNIQ